MSRKPASPGALMAVLFFGVLMGALDIAIVAPALHPIQQEFGTTPRWTAWIFSIYMLFSLIGTPLMAKLADLYGRRLVYVSNIALFAFGSLVVVAGGLTGQFWVFLAGRAVQGLGAGGIFPVAAAVIGDTVAPENRGSALGLLGAVWGLAFILGPILGGLLIPFGWTWLFLINLPIAVALVIGALLVLPSHKKGDTPPLDFRALILLAGALASFALGVNQLDTAHPPQQFSFRLGLALPSSVPRPPRRFDPQRTKKNRQPLLSPSPVWKPSIDPGLHHWCRVWISSIQHQLPPGPGHGRV